MNNNEIEVEINGLRGECWERALISYGTGAIFQDRSEKLRKYLEWLTYAGLILPLFVGAVVLAFGPNPEYLNVILWIAGVLGVIQVTIFLWSIVNKWNEKFGDSLEAMTENFQQAYDYERLAKNPPSELMEFKHGVDLLEAKYQKRNDLDEKQGVTEMEKRKGMRAGLYRFQRECFECKEVPSTMEPSNCKVCGNF